METIYPPPVPLNKLFEAINWMDDVMIDAITPHLLGKRPNTYTLTKALAEVRFIHFCIYQMKDHCVSPLCPAYHPHACSL